MREQWQQLMKEADEKLETLFNECPKCGGCVVVLYDIVDIPSGVQCIECGQVYDLDGNEESHPILDLH